MGILSEQFGGRLVYIPKSYSRIYDHCESEIIKRLEKIFATITRVGIHCENVINQVRLTEPEFYKYSNRRIIKRWSEYRKGSQKVKTNDGDKWLPKTGFNLPADERYTPAKSDRATGWDTLWKANSNLEYRISKRDCFAKTARNDSRVARCLCEEGLLLSLRGGRIDRRSNLIVVSNFGFRIWF